MATPRLVIVHRRTELQELLDRHATRGQAEFFLRTRGRSISDVQGRHDRIAAALVAVRAAIPAEWRQAEVERADLSRFLLTAEDVIAVVGQDGLVANTAKYLSGQPVIGIDPEPGANPGILVRHSPEAAAALLGRISEAGAPGLACLDLATVTARLDDGQEISALNEVFIGHASHQSARYQLSTPDGRTERQSSSGLIVSTGTGATGWCASIAGDRGGRSLPAPTDPALAWFVREAWPSPITGASLTEGVLVAGESLRITVASDQLVVFGDGMETDRLTASWGQEITVVLGGRPLRLVA
ncbi:inorganic polyphosphate kinase [Arthrobacter sp. ZBG10]|uniref:NAD(+)/NADH kinase n=1 Tax=Arthrobacter sp. ZBG10 TaxID=1676590 RepID=UPI000680A16A|nr:NAD(+)/NADH kinase [Arthrobacter sp. ZBG10]KNH16590.1 inorganic polyphosphate kinase [Arthrobacter sp. ZBG10]